MLMLPSHFALNKSPFIDQTPTAKQLVYWLEKVFVQFNPCCMSWMSLYLLAVKINREYKEIIIITKTS